MNINARLRSIATSIWLAALAWLVFAMFNMARGRGLARGTPAIVIVVVVAVILTAGESGLVFIDPEQRGVVVSAITAGGYRPDVLTPGLNWITPFAERVQIYTVSRQTYTMSSTPEEGSVSGDDSVLARTKDGQQINIDASVIYAVDPAKIIQLNLTWQGRYEEAVVRPLARGIIRDIASQYNVEEIVAAKRADFKQAIAAQLGSRLGANNLILFDFVLRDIRFSDAYAAAVEQKQIFEQQALEAALVVERKKQEAEQARASAQGQADAAVIAAQGQAQATVLEAQANAQVVTLTGDALQGRSDALTFQYIDKLTPDVRAVYIPSGKP